MGLLEEAKEILADAFGNEVADQLDNFDDPNKYPKDFIEECVFFLAKIAGQEVADKKFAPLMKKYTKPGSGKKNTSDTQPAALLKSGKSTGKKVPINAINASVINHFLNGAIIGF